MIDCETVNCTKTATISIMRANSIERKYCLKHSYEVSLQLKKLKEWFDVEDLKEAEFDKNE